MPQHVDKNKCHSVLRDSACVCPQLYNTVQYNILCLEYQYSSIIGCFATYLASTFHLIIVAAGSNTDIPQNTLHGKTLFFQFFFNATTTVTTHLHPVSEKNVGDVLVQTQRNCLKLGTGTVSYLAIAPPFSRQKKDTNRSKGEDRRFCLGGQN